MKKKITENLKKNFILQKTPGGVRATNPNRGSTGWGIRGQSAAAVPRQQGQGGGAAETWWVLYIYICYSESAEPDIPRNP